MPFTFFAATLSYCINYHLGIVAVFNLLKGDGGRGRWGCIQGYAVAGVSDEPTL
ncbi:MAG: hypothetical protein F6K58_20400 [Symploca sp. SIO2E9]|nr:hypothetical protein [Symploca sp. SIO2E9]